MRREKLIPVRQYDTVLVGGEHDRTSADSATESDAEVPTADTLVAISPGARHNSRMIRGRLRIPERRYIHQRRRHCSPVSTAIARRVRKEDHGIQGRHLARS